MLGMDDLRIVFLQLLDLVARPNLLNELTQVIDTNMQLHLAGNQDPAAFLLLRRGLKALNSIIKEFASIKLPGGIQTMAQVSDT